MQISAGAPGVNWPTSIPRIRAGWIVTREIASNRDITFSLISFSVRGNNVSRPAIPWADSLKPELNLSIIRIWGRYQSQQYLLTHLQGFHTDRLVAHFVAHQ